MCIRDWMMVVVMTVGEVIEEIEVVIRGMLVARSLCECTEMR